MKVEIRPSRAKGTVTAPPSKSMAHRLLICAGLAEGESVVRNLAYSEDVKATIACLRSLGAEITLDGDTAVVKGVDPSKPLGKTAVLPCNECGSTLRFFAPLCMLCGEERILTGSERLMSRPLSVYENLAQKQGIRFERYSDKLIVEGKLKSGAFDVPGNISSQFISGLLFALPFLREDSRIYEWPPFESMSYIFMTLQAMEEFGISVPYEYDESRGCVFLPVSHTEKYRSTAVTVEGDHSNAAFFEALNYAGSQVKVTGLNEDSAQGDRQHKYFFEKLTKTDEIVNICECPDLGPILFAVAALCGGGRFTGTRRLKIKESDRANAMKSELKKFGITVDVEENDVIVHPGELRAPTEPLCGHNDHRIVMALSVLLTKVGGVIDGAEAVSKSFPDFFDRLQNLGVDLTYGMDQ